VTSQCFKGIINRPCSNKHLGKPNHIFKISKNTMGEGGEEERGTSILVPAFLTHGSSHFHNLFSPPSFPGVPRVPVDQCENWRSYTCMVLIVFFSASLPPIHPSIHSHRLEDPLVPHVVILFFSCSESSVASCQLQRL
jgi:hypothetical protein